MKLNPKRCVFKVSTRKFLGFLVGNKGIDVKPDRINTIEGILNVLNRKRKYRVNMLDISFGRIHIHVF